METEIRQVDEQKYQLTNVPPLSVNCQMDYERVISFRNVAVERKKLIEETFNPIVEKAHAAHKQAVQTRALFLDKVMNVISTIDSNVREWRRECERKAKEEQEKIRRKAEEEAAKQRKIKEEQERAWREKEAIAKAELDRQNALIAKAKSEKARAEAEAAAARAKAEQEKAARIAEERKQQAEAVEAVVPTVAPVFEKVKGDTTRKTYRAEVVDFKILPDEYKIANVQLLNSIARSSKGTMKVPGVKFYQE